MRLRSSIITLISLLLLATVASAQLVVDKDRFDLEVHPGEAVVKTLTLKNLGDEPIYGVTITPVGGDARDMIFIEDNFIRKIDTADSDLDDNKVKIPIICIIPPEKEPGDYTGFIYVIEDSLPKMPTVVEFDIHVKTQESYDLSLTINDASFSSVKVDPEETIEFDLTVKNTGRFRDVIVIDAPEVPNGWEVSLKDGKKYVELPYNLPLSAGSTKDLTLDLDFDDQAKAGSVQVIATSLSNQSKNSTVTAEIEIGVVVRGYDVAVDIPDKIVTNQTYEGKITILLEKEETVNVEILSEPGFLILPSYLSVPVTAKHPGSGNFSFMATDSGTYPVVFKMEDSQGVPLPPEVVITESESPNGTAIVTYDDLLHRSIASSMAIGNRTVPIVTVHDTLKEDDREALKSFSDVIILGNTSEVPTKVETELVGMINVTRISGDDIDITSWLFVSAMWIDGTETVVVSDSKDASIFKAYQEARSIEAPMVVSKDGISDNVRQIVKDLKKKGLKKVLLIGDATKLAGDWEDTGLIVEVA